MPRWASALVLGLALGSPRRADACGGMLFHAEERAGTMSDQQVLIAQGVAGTVLVVGVGYKSAEQEFAFLLPLQRAPHHIAEGEKHLFKRLDETTAPRIEIIDTTKQPESSGGGCACLGGGAKAGAPAGPAGAPAEVQVVQRGETQSYEYVVVGGQEGASLAEWLEKNGFSAPPQFQNELDRYLKRGWLFMAAKLRPQTNEGELAPIEIHYDSIRTDEIEYPFELSALSVRPGTRVDITLYLVGNRPLLPDNYPVRKIANRVRAVSPEQSNYERVFDDETKTGSFVLEMGSPDAAPAGFLNYGMPPPKETPDKPSLVERASKLFPGAGTFVRLRTRLAGDRLKDMKLKSVSADDVRQEQMIVVKWDPKSNAASLLFLVGIGFMRRRPRLGA